MLVRYHTRNIQCWYGTNESVLKGTLHIIQNRHITHITHVTHITHSTHVTHVTRIAFEQHSQFRSLHSVTIIVIITFDVNLLPASIYHSCLSCYMLICHRHILPPCTK